MKVDRGNILKISAFRKPIFYISGALQGDAIKNVFNSFLTDLKTDKIKNYSSQEAVYIKTAEVIYDPENKDAVIIAHKDIDGQIFSSQAFYYSPATGSSTGAGPFESRPSKLYHALGRKKDLEDALSKPDFKSIRDYVRANINKYYNNIEREDLSEAGELDKAIDAEAKNIMDTPEKLEALIKEITQKLEATDKEIAQLKSVLNCATVPVN